FRITDFIAHDGSQVQTDEAVADGPKSGEETPVMETGAQIGGMKGASILMESEDGQEADHGRSANGAKGAEIVDPFAQGESTDVQGEQKKNDEKRGDAG